MVVDIDQFKSINDTLGHGAGDQILKQTVARLRRRLRPTDLPARMGGDELAVLLPDALRDGPERVASSIVAEIARQKITIRGQRCGTASVGWARIDEAVAAEELMIRADLAVYEAKRSGGNGACGYSPNHDTRFDGPLLGNEPALDDSTVPRGEDRDPFDLSPPARPPMLGSRSCATPIVSGLPEIRACPGPHGNHRPTLGSSRACQLGRRTLPVALRRPATWRVRTLTCWEGRRSCFGGACRYET